MKLRITPVRCLCFDDLQERFAVESEMGPCTAFELGKPFAVAAPEDLERLAESGLCRTALGALRGAVYTAFQTGRLDGWTRQGDVGFVSCPDGMRPVVFEVAIVDE